MRRGKEKNAHFIPDHAQRGSGLPTYLLAERNLLGENGDTRNTANRDIYINPISRIPPLSFLPLVGRLVRTRRKEHRFNRWIKRHAEPALSADRFDSASFLNPNNGRIPDRCPE
ncbi:MAG: hypothetical protein ACOC4Z_01195 [Patescibacteria group bacterium]